MRLPKEATVPMSSATILANPGEEESNTSPNPTFDSVLQARLSRRHVLRGSIGGAATALLGSLSLTACGGSEDDDGSPTPASAEKLLGFTAVGKSLADSLVVPVGYTATVLYALGDPLTASTARIARRHRRRHGQPRGDHHDGMEFFGLGASGAVSAAAVDRGLLAINHEATTDETLSSFFLHANGGTPSLPRPAAEVDKETAIHGIAVGEVRKAAAGWSYVRDSAFNRRLTALSDMEISGPAAGQLLVTRTPRGTATRGTLNNCGTGKTPWAPSSRARKLVGYFARGAADDAARGMDKSVTLPAALRPQPGRPRGTAWETGGADDRYAAGTTAGSAHRRTGSDDYRNEMNGMGYIVEVDPYDSTRRRRSAALSSFCARVGRLRNRSSATPGLLHGRRLARRVHLQVRLDIVVSAADATAADRVGTGDKYLDAGTLYVAKFAADGSGSWLELTVTNPAIAGYAATYPLPIRPTCSSTPAWLPMRSEPPRWTGPNGRP